MKRILDELTRLAAAVPEEIILRCAQKLSAHERIFLHGAGRSGLMLRALAMRLAQTGRSVYVAGDCTTPAIGEGDLLIVASASGTTHSVCRFAEIALACGAEVMVVTARADSPLTALAPADAVLPAPSKDEAGASIQPMGSLFEQGLLLFADAVVSRMEADAPGMRRRHANLE